LFKKWDALNTTDCREKRCAFAASDKSSGGFPCEFSATAGKILRGPRMDGKEARELLRSSRRLQGALKVSEEELGDIAI
jgi:hypothetical protein